MSPVVVPGAVLTAVLAGAGVAGWKVFVEPTAMERCVATATRQQDRLLPIAEEQFRSVVHTVIRYDDCDDTGDPYADVRVRIDGWTVRREGIAFLRAAGWRWDPAAQDATIEGHVVRVGVVRSGEGDGPWHVEVVFTFPS